MSGYLRSLPLQRAEQSGPAKQGAKQMSPHVGNFVQDLVEMAKAMEALPIVTAQLAESRALHGETLDATARLQERIIGYKHEIETLQARIREAEVARDDAELRFLEVEERISHALAHAGSMAAHMGTLMATLDPPKPEPTALPYTDTATAELAEGSVQQDPIAAMPETDPTATTMASQPNDASPTLGSMVHGEAAQALDTAPSSSPYPGPYFGKRYRDVPGYIAIGDWIDGGGTKDDYYAPKTWAS